MGGWVVGVLVGMGCSAPACLFGGYAHSSAPVPGSFEGLGGTIKQTFDR